MAEFSFLCRKEIVEEARGLLDLIGIPTYTASHEGRVLNGQVQLGVEVIAVGSLDKLKEIAEILSKNKIAAYSRATQIIMKKL